MLQVSQRDYVEKAAQAGAGDEEHHRDEQLNHAADNNTVLELRSNQNAPQSERGVQPYGMLSLTNNRRLLHLYRLRNSLCRHQAWRCYQRTRLDHY